MLTEAQIQYITEVLGAPVEGYFRSTATSVQDCTLPPEGDSSVKKAFPVAILSPPLAPEEQVLLDRILASVNLKDVPQLRSPEEASQAVHLLVFSDEVPFGRHPRENGVTWGLHSLQAMAGEGPCVMQAKKAVWTLLQQFSRERRGE